MLKSIWEVKFIEPGYRYRKVPLDFLQGMCSEWRGPHSLGTSMRKS